MTHYAIGDLQGCYDELRRLLDALRFDPARDRLLFAGDLVNRGPQSLQCLRFVRGLGPAAATVLGNHDLHLLACAHGRRQKAGDTLDAVLGAADRQELIEWLAAQPLALWEPASETLIVHAGLAPQWTRDDALQLSAEVQAVLRDARRREAFFAQMYGDKPRRWDPALGGWERLRFAVNCFTRLRFCAADGTLDLQPKGAPGSQPPGLLPWFEIPGRRSATTRIVFGHWSTLGREQWPEANVWGLDTGCVWGGRLTALALEGATLHSVSCAGHCRANGGGD